MARKMSTQPRTGLGNGPEHGSILDHFPDAPRETPTAKADGPNIAELMERLGEINARLDQQDRETAIADNMRTPAAQAPAAQVPQPTLNLEGLPDPLQDPQAYGRALAERTLKYQNDVAQFTQQRAQPQVGGDLDQLWEDFQDAHPEYTGDNNRIKFATTQVVERLKKRGVDVQRFMFAKSERFFDMMTEEYDATFGNPTDEEYEDAPEDEPAPRRRASARTDDDDGDDGRTDGVLGGGDAPGQRQNARQPVTGLIEDLQAIQRKTGYY